MVFDMKRRQGQYIGGFPLYGYRRDPMDKHHLLVDPEAAVVRRIFQFAMDGYSKQQIAKMLNDRGIANPTRYKAEHNGQLPSANDPDPNVRRIAVAIAYLRDLKRKSLTE